ncbi:MAG: hypothetical protein HRU09_06100 [Oligoflexales bacterium]|nr:hypothetical protein [Oligoflexales bacterium]
MLKNKLPLALALFSACFLESCISQSYEEPSEVISSGPPHYAGGVDDPQQVNEPEDRNQLIDFINKFNSENAAMTPADEDYLDSLPSDPEHLSLEETALGLGLVHKWLAIVERRGPQIEEAELPEDESSEALNQPKVPEEWPRSLEELLADKQINFPRALSANAYLKSFHFQQMVLEALKTGSGQSDRFIAGVKSALKENARVWGQLQKELEGQNNLDDEVAQEGEQEAQTQEDKIAPALPFGGNTFVSDEDLLKDAQTLLDQGEHYRAVERLRSMSEDSLFYATSMEKIKEISNVAVQELRRKAARAFQSAKPIADRKTRAAYLTEAKDFLEQAIELYPTADQIPTVRENLEVINKSLEVLNNQISQSSP